MTVTTPQRHGHDGSFFTFSTETTADQADPRQPEYRDNDLC
jgi:hypothetical protein